MAEQEHRAVERAGARQKRGSRVVVTWRPSQAGAAQWGEAWVVPLKRGATQLWLAGVRHREQSVKKVDVKE